MYYPITYLALYVLAEISSLFSENRDIQFPSDVVAPMKVKFIKYFQGFLYLFYFGSLWILMLSWQALNF